MSESVTVRASVAYFDQHLSAVHSKHWSKYAFLSFFMPKSLTRRKKQEICCKILQKKMFFFSLDQNAGLRFSENNSIFLYFLLGDRFPRKNSRLHNSIYSITMCLLMQHSIILIIIT